VTGRILIAAAVTALGLGCGSLRSTTRGEREAASRRVAMKMEGSVVTEGELFQMDMDRTFVCGTEPQVGSHIPRYQCRTLRRVVRQRESAAGYVLANAGAAGGHLPGERAPLIGSSAARAMGAGAAAMVTTTGSKTTGSTAPGSTAPGSRVVKKEDRPEDSGGGDSLPSTDQDPRFPPL